MLNKNKAAQQKGAARVIMNILFGSQVRPAKPLLQPLPLAV